MDAIECLLGRNSAPKLQEPAPDAQALEKIYQAAFRAPDHARLRPWRFLVIKDQARDKLGELFSEALKKRNPDSTEDELNKVKSKPMRAPLLIVVIAKLIPHKKIPRDEQLLSAGCAAHSMMLACHALGYAGIWRTGGNAYDPYVMKGLGLADNEVVVGFLYIGSINGKYKPLRAMDIGDYVSDWREIQR